MELYFQYEVRLGGMPVYTTTSLPLAKQKALRLFVSHTYVSIHCNSKLLHIYRR